MNRSRFTFGLRGLLGVCCALLVLQGILPLVIVPGFLARYGEALRGLAQQISSSLSLTFIAGTACAGVASYLIYRGLGASCHREETEAEPHSEVEQRLHLLAAALEAAANGVVITDREGTIVWVNQAVTLLTGYQSEELVGKNTRMLKSGCHEAGFYRELWDTINAGRPWRNEVINRRRDGSLYNEEVTITPVRDRLGWVTHFVGIKQDIGERKKTEEAMQEGQRALAQKNRELQQALDRAAALTAGAERAGAVKSDFLRMMSHEVRTPLNAVMGLNQLLQETPLSPPQRRYTEMIGTSADSLLRLFSDILDFSSMEAGTLRVERVSFNPRQVVDDVTATFQTEAQDKGLELRAQLKGEVPAKVLGDPQRLSQIVGNLVSNALKFTDSGKIGIVLHAEQQGKDQVALEFSVTDTGRGIEEAVREQLFQPFHQLDTSKCRSNRGTGLGLAIARRLTELLGGHIGCTSTPGKGSTFTVSIPCSTAAGSSAVAAGASPAPAVRFPGREVLLVEDNELNQLVATEHLKKAGVSVTLAGDGLCALQEAEKKTFDLILMDVQMPVMDGLTATRELRARGVTVPIVALSANTMPSDVEACLQAGMSAHLGKPFSLRDIQEVLVHWLPVRDKEAVPPAPEKGEGAGKSAAALDFERGVRQVGGEGLYRDVLRLFARQYGGAGEELTRLLSAEDAQGAALLAHSLKGSSGIIAAGALQEAAAKLEARLKGGGAWQAELAAADAALKRVIKAVEEALLAGESASAAEGKAFP